MKTDADVQAELAASLRLVVGRLSRRLRQHAIGGSTASQLSALAAIERDGPLPLGRLARLEAVSPPTMTGIVTRLHERGLVERRPDERDARSVVVSITGEGRRMLAVVRNERTAFLADRIARLDDGERATLCEAVGLLAGILEDERP